MAIEHNHPRTENEAPVRVRSLRKSFGTQIVLQGIDLVLLCHKWAQALVFEVPNPFLN